MSKRKIFIRTIAAAIISAAIISLPACGGEKVSEETFFSMDTAITVKAYGTNAKEGVSSAKDEIERLAILLDAERLSSESGEPEVVKLVEKAIDISDKCGGALDITVYPAVKAWGFISGNHRVPDENELAELMKLTGSDKITLAEGGFNLFPGSEITLGAIAKGYAADRAADVLRDAGVESAVLSLGGNVRLVGSKPDGEDWLVGIRDPEGDASDISLGLYLSDCSVVTSGGYERYFTEGGKTYHHILDPATLRPAESDLLSVTVVSKDGTLADALSTALFVLGLEKASDYFREYGSIDGFEAVFITADDIYVTAGIADAVKKDAEREIKVIG